MCSSSYGEDAEALWDAVNGISLEGEGATTLLLLLACLPFVPQLPLLPVMGDEFRCAVEAVLGEWW